MHKRRVIEERLVACFADRRGPFVWRARVGPGFYFARFTMLKDGRPYDARRLVLQRTASGRFTQRRDHYRRDSCGLLGRFKLERPVFGGPRNAPLGVAYRLASPAQVTVTVSRGGTVVKRFATASRPANRTHRVSLPSRGLPRGEYTVRLTVARGDEQVTSRLVARRL